VHRARVNLNAAPHATSLILSLPKVVHSPVALLSFPTHRPLTSSPLPPPLPSPLLSASALIAALISLPLDSHSSTSARTVRRSTLPRLKCTCSTKSQPQICPANRFQLVTLARSCTLQTRFGFTVGTWNWCEMHGFACHRLPSWWDKERERERGENNRMNALRLAALTSIGKQQTSVKQATLEKVLKVTLQITFEKVRSRSKSECKASSEQTDQSVIDVILIEVAQVFRAQFASNLSLISLVSRCVHAARRQIGGQCRKAA
jgi:hypothetical protein